MYLGSLCSYLLLLCHRWFRIFFVRLVRGISSAFWTANNYVRCITEFVIAHWKSLLTTYKYVCTLSWYFFSHIRIFRSLCLSTSRSRSASSSLDSSITDLRSFVEFLSLCGASFSICFTLGGYFLLGTDMATLNAWHFSLTMDRRISAASTDPNSDILIVFLSCNRRSSLSWKVTFGWTVVENWTSSQGDSCLYLARQTKSAAASVELQYHCF